MIDENFYQAAINIRKTYLKISNDMESYRNIAESSLKNIQRSIVSIENIKKGIGDKKKENLDRENNMDTINKISEILESLEMEGKKIERFVDPINKEIEKLAEEEQNLYRKICERHSDLTEAQIVEAVRLRLKKEDLL